MLKGYLIATPLLTASLLMSGCSDVRSKLGLNPEAPDEFTVYDRAPLSVPPQFSLRPPRPGEARPHENTLSNQAEKILTKGSLATPKSADNSAGQNALLEKAGTQNADPNIRQQVDQDLSLEQNPTDKKLLDDVLFWQKKSPEGNPIDPKKEKKRLEELKKSSPPSDQ